MRISLFFLLSVFAISAAGQDYIHLRSGETIECKVTFIGISVVSYKELSNMDLEIEIPKAEIEEISIENGRTYRYYENFSDEEVKVETPQVSKKNAIRVGPLSPAWGSLRLEYDRRIRAKESLFTSINLIGLGAQNTGINRGIGLSVGYKFALTGREDSYRSYSISYFAQSYYIMPEVAFSAYRNEYEYNYFNPATFGTETGVGVDFNSGVAVIANFGRQFTIGRLFVMDMSVGLGYGYVDRQVHRDRPGSDEPIGWFGEDGGTQMFNFIHMGNDAPLVIKTRLSIGLLL